MLAWCLQGWLDYQRQGLNPPNAVIEATDEYRGDNDLLAQFIEYQCDQAPDLWVNSTIFLAKYTEWCREQGESGRLTAKSLVEQMAAKGYAPKPKKHGKGFSGVSLIDD